MPAYHNQFPDRDPGPRRLAFIGEALGTSERARGLPFQGAAGQKLNEQLSKVGLLRSEVFCGNVAAVQPDSNEFDSLDWASSAVQDGIAALLADLAVYRPTLVVTLGNVPLHLFLVGNGPPPRRKSGKRSVYAWPRKVTAWRGSLFASSPLATAHLWISDDPDTARAFDFTSNENASLVGPAESDTKAALNMDRIQDLPGSPVRKEPRDLPAFVLVAGESKPTELEGLRTFPVTASLASAAYPSGEPTRAVVASGAEISGGSGTAAPSTPTPTVVPAPDRMLAPGTVAVARWKCLATLHPAYVLRVKSDEFDLQNDLRRAAIEARTTTLNLPALDFDYGPR